VNISFIYDRIGSETVSVAKAVRFGGFQGGGYSHETNDVWVLSLGSKWSAENGFIYSATWERIETTGILPKARAYHTATLIHDRYLVIIGGMTSEGSCMEEAILDTTTWTWFDISLASRGEPMGRHGHSTVWDNRRDRLVMFGGGSGTDLLRSGMDGNEVWELKMRGIIIPENLESSKMWEWNRLHGGMPSREDDSISREYRDDMDDSEDSEMEYECDFDHLTLAESLCLGRCHNGMKIAPDTYLCVFGGGRVNTNNVLGYSLSKDIFIRPQVSGTLPIPRFTAIATFLDEEGYIFVHGGYNSNSGGCIQDITLLDVAPFLNRNFTAMPVDAHRVCHGEVTEAEAAGAYGYLYEYGLTSESSPSALMSLLMNDQEY
jgi:hypothetical protein